MTPLRRLLRSWRKEEIHAKPSARVIRSALALALMLLAPLFLLHLRHRVLSGQNDQQQRLQESLGIVEASFGSLTRAALDWGHWDSLYGYVSGSNPKFPVTDIQTTALFDGGMVLLLLKSDGQPQLIHAVRSHRPKGSQALVRCARGGLGQLPSVASTVRLFCRDGGGRAYLGVATPISNNDSTAPRRGTLVFLDPLQHAEFAAEIRRSLLRFERNLIWKPPAAARPEHRQASQLILPPILGEGGRLLAFRPQPLEPILAQVLLEDLLLALAFGLGLLGFRSILLLERRRQRLLRRQQTRLGDARIRRVCRELDLLHAELGVNARAASQGRQTLARLMRRRLSYQPEWSPLPAAADQPAPELAAGAGGGPTPEAGATPGSAAAPIRPGQQDLDARLQRLADRFQEFLESAQTLALIDPLTRLPNRRFFLDQLALLSRSNRQKQSRYAVFFVDIDRFKAINDTFGHHAGDAVLKAVADRLRQQLRPGDFLARYGGDELAILMDLSGASPASEAQQREHAHQLANRLTDALAEPVLVEGLAIELSLSVGIALVDPRITDTAQAMQQSDLAMYRAKRHKHHRIAIFDVEDHASKLDSYQLYLELMQAVREKQLQVYFQPIVDAERRIVGVEALARWPHPRLGTVAPEMFLDLAEQHRQLDLLWQAILEVSLRDFAALRQQLPQLLLSLNLSPTQLSDQRLMSQLHKQLDQHGVSPGLVTIEITERAILEASPLVRQTLHQLREAGIRISLDDFGTGHSSLTLLSQLRPDELKIDRSFVSTMENDPYAHHIVALIAGLAHNLGISVVAEGVEDQQTLATLAQLGVQRFQGYLFAKPCPWQEIPTLCLAPNDETSTPA